MGFIALKLMLECVKSNFISLTAAS